MKKITKRSFLGLLLVGAFSFVLLLSFGKPTTIRVENKFGTFCLECKTYESGRGIGIYGFGLAFCNDNIREMSNRVNYDEIDNYRLFLKDKGFSEIATKVAEIEHYLKSDNTENYVYAVQEYITIIEDLNQPEKEIVLSFFRN